MNRNKKTGVVLWEVPPQPENLGVVSKRHFVAETKQSGRVARQYPPPVVTELLLPRGDC
jgi:hypothetical protein